MAGEVGAPAQIDVVAHEGEHAVEAAELLVDVAADEHAGGGDGQDGADLVVLALVLLAAVQPGPAAAAVGDGDADFEELLAVVPAAQLGADDRGVPVGVDDAQHRGERVRLGGAVVVQQPEPLDRFAVGQFGEVVVLVHPGAGGRVPATGALEVGQLLRGQDAGRAGRLVDGGAEARTAGEVQDAFVAERLRDQPGRVVRASGVGGDDVLYGAFLPEQPRQHVGQPAGAVVGDEHGGDDVPGELWGGGGRVRRRRVAVHGHRGTGPPAGSGGVIPGGCIGVHARPGGALARLGRGPTLTVRTGGGVPCGPRSRAGDAPTARPPRPRGGGGRAVGVSRWAGGGRVRRRWAAAAGCLLYT